MGEDDQMDESSFERKVPTVMTSAKGRTNGVRKTDSVASKR